MADEKRSLILDLLARNKMGGPTNEAARDLDKLGTAADKTSKKTEDLGKASIIAGRGVDKLGNQAKDTQGKIESLDAEIRNSQRELAGLAAAFATAGSAAERLDLSKAMRRTESDIRGLTKSKGLLEGILPDPEPAARSWAAKLNQSLGTSLSSLGANPAVAVAGGVLGAAIAPTLGAAIAGAVVGGVGMGGLLGGIALAASADKEIQETGAKIGSSFKTAVSKEATDAFSGPVLLSLGKLEALAERSVPKIGKIFDSLAPSLSGLTDHLVRSGDAIMDSLVHAGEKAGPVMDVLGRIIEDTSTNLGRFIDMAADHADEGASALEDLNTALQSTIDVTTRVVGALATMKGGLDDMDGWIDKQRYKLEDSVSWLDLTADGYEKGSEAAALYRQGLIGVAGSANDYDHYVQRAVNATSGLTEAQSANTRVLYGQRDALSAVSAELRAQTDPAFAVLNAQDKLSTAQDKLNKDTKKYGENSQQARKDARDLALASLDLQGAVGNLSGTFNGELTPAMVNTMRSAGMTEGQIAAVKREFQRAKAAGDAYAKDYKARIITQYITKYSGVAVSSAQQAYEETKRSIAKRASGGPVSRGTPYLVGENGPEVVVPSAAGRVLSAASSRGMAKNGIAGAPVGAMGIGSATVQLEVIGDEEVRTFVRRMIRSMNLLQDSAA